VSGKMILVDRANVRFSAGNSIRLARQYSEQNVEQLQILPFF
jgi:hypothetical protein